MSFHLVPVLALLAAALLAACSGDDDGGVSTGGGALDAPLSALAVEDLPLLVLAPEGWGELAEGMTIDPESGFNDNANAARATLDPEDTADSLAVRGRIGGYGLALQSSNTSEGTFALTSSVELARDAPAAQSFLEQRLGEFDVIAGQVADGLTYGEPERFDAGTIGDGATGIRTNLTTEGGTELYFTLVAFRIGRLSAVVGLTSFDDTDHSDDLIAAARAQEAHIARVLSGEVEATPPFQPPEPTATPTAGPTPEPTPSGPPAGAPDLAPVALRPDDISESFVASGESYTLEEGTISSYARVMQLPETGTFGQVGGSQVGQVESNVLLFEDEAAAEAFMASSRMQVTGEDGADLLRQVLESQGFTGVSVAAEGDDLALGDEGFQSASLAQTDMGNYAVAYLYVRIGAAVSAATISAGDPFSLDDMRPLAEAAAGRLALLEQP